MLPLDGFSNKLIHLKSVDLPHPEGPIIDTTSPSKTLKLIPFYTCNLLKLFFIFLISSII